MIDEDRSGHYLMVGGFPKTEVPPPDWIDCPDPQTPGPAMRQRAQAVMWVLATVAMVLATTFLGLLLAVWAHWVILFWW